MLKSGFNRILTSKRFRSNFNWILPLNLSFQKMNVSGYPKQTTLLNDYMAINEDASHSCVYIMSKITRLPWFLEITRDKVCPELCFKEIHMSDDTDIIDPSSFELQNAEVVICDPVILGCNYKNMPKLQWAHCTWAGVDSLFAIMKEKPNFIVTRHTHEHFSQLIAEYVMAHVLMIEKNFRNMWAVQMEKSWEKLKACSESSRQLNELTLGILGVGNMGQAIARFLKPLGITVIGLSRTPRKSSEFGLFDSIEISLDKVLSSSDYIVNTLPSTPETVGLLDGDILKKCIKKKPAFINVGRGDIVHEDTLVKSLQESWLSYLVLDVFQVEPLPPESPLWEFSNVIITPHCAAESLPENIAKDFMASYLNYVSKKPLNNIVDWGKGY